MIPMKLSYPMIFRFALAAMSLVAFSSCEDKALIQKNEKLRVEVSELEKEVSYLEIQAGEDPGDQSAAIEQTNKNMTKALEELERLDDERVKQEQAHKELEKEFRDYQKKYQIK